MKLTTVDWTIVAAYFLFNLAIGFYYRGWAGKNTGEFFLSGRNAPWWLERPWWRRLSPPTPRWL